MLVKRWPAAGDELLSQAPEHVQVCIHVCVRMLVCMHTWGRALVSGAGARPGIHACVYVGMYVYLHTHMLVSMYTYIHIRM
jgi:hypothetical protein